MAGIYPVASARVSDALIQARLLSQFEFDQLELVKLQDQVSTGYRFSTPSEDAPAAIRAMALQRLLEQKAQAKTNLQTADSFNSATDTALSGASDMLINIRAVALGAINSASNPEQSAVLRNEINDTIEQFLDIGNRQFRGRYLFAGSKTNTPPFTQDSRYVAYQGNMGELQSYVDLARLSEANVTGVDAFGAISDAVAGGTDLNPKLTPQTRLSDLRAGRGISLGSFAISDGMSTSVIDVASATTVGDVMRMIEANPPPGRQVSVQLSQNGFILDLDDAGGGSLVVQEVQGGSTAAHLGIVTPSAGIGPFQGTDLNPALRPTTSLKSLLGMPAEARLPSSGQNNDLVVQSARNGPEYNGVTIRYVSGVAVGETAIASYNDGTRTLTIDISPGVTRARNVVDAINATGLFTAEVDSSSDLNNDGSGTVQLSSVATLSGGSGQHLDLAEGLQIVNGGQAHTLRFSEAETVEDFLNILNGSSANVFATINAAGTGIDIRSRLSGSDFMVGENGGNLATQLGVRTMSSDTALSELNFGRGVTVQSGDDLVIQRRDGVRLNVDLSSARTVGDVLDAINNHPSNAGGGLRAQLVSVGNGIELVDRSVGAGNLTVARTVSTAAWELGLVPRGQEQIVANAVAPGQPQSITGADVNPQEPKGVFNSLLKLSRAIETSDLAEIERTLAMLDDDFSDLSFVRAELGARTRSLETLSQRIDGEEIDLKSALSVEIDADLAEAVSELAARQANLEASLRLIAQSLDLTVFNFL